MAYRNHHEADPRTDLLFALAGLGVIFAIALSIREIVHTLEYWLS